MTTSSNPEHGFRSELFEHIRIVNPKRLFAITALAASGVFVGFNTYTDHLEPARECQADDDAWQCKTGTEKIVLAVMYGAMVGVADSVNRPSSTADSNQKTGMR